MVSFHSVARAKNGMSFDNRCCWIVNFRDALMVRVRAHLDSDMVDRLLEENPIQKAAKVQTGGR